MKILSYKKINKNSYEVKLENNDVILLCDEVILKNDLLLKHNISLNELNKLLDDNKIYLAYYKALSYLSSKMRTKKEIKEYLKKNNYKEDIINEVIKILESKNLINEELYLKTYLNDSIKLSLDGPKKIEKKLIDLGIDKELIDIELNKIDKEVWFNKLRKIINKKINTNHKDSTNKLKEKIIYNCTNNGYYKEDILSILSEFDFNNDNILKQEGDKLYNKLKNKYSDKELIFNLKKKLISKGFNYEEINEYLSNLKSTD